jgi:isopenicillin N synthase-like dioxygenase
MLFRDRRVKFKSPQVEALAKASAAGARGIKAMPDTSKDSWKKEEGREERRDVKQSATKMINESKYHASIGEGKEMDRGDAYKEAARMQDMTKKMVPPAVPKKGSK